MAAQVAFVECLLHFKREGVQYFPGDRLRIDVEVAQQWVLDGLAKYDFGVKW